MNDKDFHDAEDIFIRANRDAYPDREACEILSRAKNYLTNQWDRQPQAYVKRVELEVAGKSTRRFDIT